MQSNVVLEQFGPGFGVALDQVETAWLEVDPRTIDSTGNRAQ
jgi:hypothetical protein